MIPIVTHTATFKRLTNDVGDSDKETWQDVSGLIGISCNVQPASAKPSEIATGVFDKKHIMFVSTTCSGVREGYRVTISGLYDGSLNNTLTVDGVEDWNTPPLPHYQITLSEIEQ
jgi:hypothetical protein